MKTLPVVVVATLVVLMDVMLIQAQLDTQFGYRDCPCRRREDCITLPEYGFHPLDILIYGIHEPCPQYGSVRCCQRFNLTLDHFLQPDADLHRLKDLEFVQLVALERPDENETHCGCVPRGICIDGQVSVTSDCSGSLERCCLVKKQPNPTQSHTQFTRPSPVFKPEFLPCIDQNQCDRIYGQNYLDVAHFGSLPPCQDFGKVRCLKPVDRIADDSDGHSLIKPVPPSIYVNDNGTLIISGGRPVFYLPEDVASSIHQADSDPGGQASSNQDEGQMPGQSTTTEQPEAQDFVQATMETDATTEAEHISSTSTMIDVDLSSSEAQLSTPDPESLKNASVLETNDPSSNHSYDLSEDNPAARPTNPDMTTAGLVSRAVDMLQKILGIFLASPQTQVHLDNGNASLKLQVDRDNVLGLLKSISSQEVISK